MNKTFKKKWVKALRSGKYEQGKGCLREEISGKDTFCCLGVACDLLRPNLWKKEGTDFSLRMRPGYVEPGDDKGVNSSGYMPEKLAEEIGIEWKTQRELSKLNDNDRSSFSTIADFIEEKL